ncbi:MAG: YlmH/Sll1252 family protein [Bacillota bacterium]|nr:YlmH/Sll1252 family protein [Bacillota bacterium]
MDKKDLLKKFNNSDDRMLLSKILDRAEKTETSGTVMFTDFLDPHQQKLVEKALSSQPGVKLTFFSGYPGAERAIAVLSPNDVVSEDDCDKRPPVKLLNIAIKSRNILTHRDFLGALMALGIKREKIGDIFVREDSCSVLVMEDIAEYIRTNLTKAGNSELDTEITNVSEISVPEPKVKEISSTVASLRLDSIASVGFGISRSKMTEFIKAEKVSLNWEAVSSTSKIVKESDTISIKGKGRVVVKSVGGMTKKGRIGIKLERML